MEFLDPIHIVVRIASSLITAGLLVELYSLWLMLHKRQTKGQIALTVGVIYQAIGIFVQLHIGLNVGGVWIIQRLVEIETNGGYSFPISLLLGLVIGVLTVAVLREKVRV